MKTIVYIDGQNFLYKVAERLLSANLISDKQDIISLDIYGLLSPLFPNQDLEIRYYGVRRIGNSSIIDEQLLEKSRLFAANLRQFKNYLRKNNVNYIGKGSLKLRALDECTNCGFVDKSPFLFLKSPIVTLL